MADADLRALERRWLESRSTEDEVRWHAARLRAGRVTEQGLVIAAGLGHEASARLAPSVGLGPLELLDHPESSPGKQPGARARAALGLARAMAALHVVLLPRHSDEHQAPREERIASVQRSLQTAETWARCPCPHHAASMAWLPEIALNDCAPACCWEEADFAGQLVGLALDAIAECARRAPRGRWFFPSAAALFAPETRQARLDEGMPAELQRAAEEAIRAAVLPWALGLSDPLRDAP